MTAPLALPANLTATLVLVRHGESVWVAEGRFQGRLDPQLSKLGRRQAQLAADRLVQRDRGAPLPVPAGPPLGVWHSPLSRAAQTARTIAAAQPATTLHRADDLVEIGQGEWEGLLHTEVAAGWPNELARWRRMPTAAHAPGGEPLLEAAQRVRSAGATIVAALATEPRPDAASEPWAVVVAHDGIFRLLVMTLLGLPYERFWSLPFNLCAISVISLRDGAAVLSAHNLSDHLAPLAADERAAEEARGDRRGAL